MTEPPYAECVMVTTLRGDIRRPLKARSVARLSTQRASRGLRLALLQPLLERPRGYLAKRNGAGSSLVLRHTRRGALSKGTHPLGGGRSPDSDRGPRSRSRELPFIIDYRWRGSSGETTG
jgi:hypothetical protein